MRFFKFINKFKGGDKYVFTYNNVIHHIQTIEYDIYYLNSF